MAKESMKAREVKREKNGSSMLRKESFVRGWRFCRNYQKTLHLFVYITDVNYR
jgi:hypothetical protein